MTLQQQRKDRINKCVGCRMDRSWCLTRAWCWTEVQQGGRDKESISAGRPFLGKDPVCHGLSPPLNERCEVTSEVLSDTNMHKHVIISFYWSSLSGTQRKNSSSIFIVRRLEGQRSLTKKRPLLKILNASSHKFSNIFSRWLIWQI